MELSLVYDRTGLSSREKGVSLFRRVIHDAGEKKRAVGVPQGKEEWMIEAELKRIFRRCGAGHENFSGSGGLDTGFIDLQTGHLVDTADIEFVEARKISQIGIEQSWQTGGRQQFFPFDR